MNLALAFQARIVVQEVRDVAPILDNSCLLELKDCLYVLEYRKNLILVSNLCKLNYSMVLNNKQVCSKMNDLFICLESLLDNRYYVSPLSLLPSNENNHIPLKRKEISTNQTQFWHYNQAILI